MAKVAFIGAGQMAEALIKGLINAQLYFPDEIIASDVSKDRLKYIASTYGIQTSSSNKEVVKLGEIVILAVKPQHLEAVVKEIGSLTADSQLIVSLAAGVPLAKIKPHFQQTGALIRVMPNTPALIGAGMTAIVFEPQIKNEWRQKIRAIFEAVGEVEEVSEELMNAVTAISGSGPAYYFLFCQALAEAGKEVGLPANLAYSLSRQTFYGAALLLKENPNEAELIKKVASPGGTTEAALKKFTELGLETIVKEAVQAAVIRGKELAALLNTE